MILLFFLTFLGAFALYIYSKNRGVQPMSICSACNANVSKTGKAGVIMFDAIITSLLGAAIGYAITQPATNAQAMAAGLGFTGLISAGGKHGK